VVWALWHLPLWFLPGGGWDIIPFWAFALGAVSSSVLFTYVVNNTGGSLLMASIIHFALNYGLGVMRILGWLPAPRAAWIISAVLNSAYAALIVLASRGEWMARAETSEVVAADRTLVRETA
jgi:hypothetical protein